MMQSLVLIGVFLSMESGLAARLGQDFFQPPNHDYPVAEMIAREGYPVETHTVITEDCYILDMHRIPNSRSRNDTSKPRPAVYLQHGMLGSAADWVMGIPEKSLGYILADAGYDVWLGNYRGNTYSRKHCTLKPWQKKFWRFSWDHMGKYDIPAMIDKVLKVTGQEKLFYVGHSMGTTGFMVMANLRPEYQDKVILANLLAPVAYVHHMKSPIRLMAPFAGSIQWILSALGMSEFLPSNWLMDLLVDAVCSEESPQLAATVCKSVLFLLCGFDKAQLNETLLETITHHTPAGTSTMTVVQYAQEVSAEKFQAYDYGRIKNQDIYGQRTPPEYKLKGITAPIAVYYSLNDWLSQPMDVHRTIRELPNVVHEYLVPFDLWNHLDFIWGIDANKFVYEELLKTMSKHSM